MAGILSLPPELIRLIGDKAEQKALRTTCRYFEDVVTPGVLSSLAIDLPRKAASTLELLEALSTNSPRTQRWSNCVRNLTVMAFYPTRTRPWKENQLLELDYCLSILKLKLERAVLSLTRLRRVVWNLGTRVEPDWIHNTFVAGLATLPLLESLELNISYGRPSWDMKLDRFSTLNTLTFTVDQRHRYHCYSSNGVAEQLLISRALLCNQNIRRLGVFVSGDCPGIPEGLICLDDLLNPRVHLANNPKNLVRLTLFGVTPKLSPSNAKQLTFLKSISLENGPPHNSDFDDLWDLLRKEQVHLEEITVDRATTSLIEYLTHYSGLERLELLPSTHRISPLPHKDTLASFLHQILPHHSRSLRRLSLMAVPKSDWCITLDIINMLRRCAQLCHLGFLVDMKAEIDSNSGLELYVETIITTIAIEMKKLMTLSIDTICELPSKDGNISSFSTLMLSLHVKEYIHGYILKYRSKPPVRRLPDIRQGRKLFSGVKCVDETEDGYMMRYIETASGQFSSALLHIAADS
ncbi:hypothetical protein Agabi119p4_7088 [Agaricus bisporus var. burnettii]|uniref:Uncharacterized protein n=1 Tax=Agaricus bisporus var. burnettii TaxID=192524 RepID=A0A8H7F0R4_AGABI|nr:hypothetical protein Agabi119p4_7088 [Agaricus bisporus var. burnettii]